MGAEVNSFYRRYLKRALYDKYVEHDGTEKYEIEIVTLKKDVIYWQVYENRLVENTVYGRNTIMYSQIVDVGLTIAPIFADTLYISLVNDKRITIEFYKKFTGEIQEILDYIQKRAAEVQSSNGRSNNSSGASVADEILKLKQLLDMGAITQQEFEEQKRKLL